MEIGSNMILYNEECEKEICYGKGKNLYASIPATDSSHADILLSAHTDTVNPCDPIIPIIKDGTLKSDGSSVLGGDNKAGIAIILEAVTSLMEQKLPHGKMELFFSSAEEVGLEGAKHLDFDYITSHSAIVLDSSGGPGTIISSSPTHDVFAITIQGKKSHAGIAPEKGINAIKAAGLLISKFDGGKIDKYSVANFGIISGGIAHNVVPDMVEIQGEIRSHKQKHLEKHGKKLTALCRKVAKKTGTRIQLSIKREYDGFKTTESNPLFQSFKSACQESGIICSPKVAGGGSDANILNSKNINSINITCGMYNIHSNEEYVELKEMEQISNILVLLITKFLHPLEEIN